jgi:MFS superfamily sulfate permease-like transporter
MLARLFDKLQCCTGSSPDYRIRVMSAMAHLYGPAMVVATIIIGLLGGESTGVHVAGHIPSGLPHLALPHFDSTTMQELTPGALAIVLIGCGAPTANSVTIRTPF